MRNDPVYVPRTGDAAIRLDRPSLTAHVSTATGDRDTRWHEISVWEAESLGRRLCLAIAYRSTWHGELGRDDAEVIAGGDLRARLRAHDPLAFVAGYPPIPSYRDRQMRLESDLRARWDHAVSEVLAAMEVWDRE